MEPFRIQCETCRSRLKICSPEVIGEIHACPKCGSMVHIQPPPGWTADSPSQSPAATGGVMLSSAVTESLIIPATATAELAADFTMPTEAAPVVPALAEPSPVAVSRAWFVWAAAAVAAVVVGGVTMAVVAGRRDKADTPPVAVAAPVATPAEAPKPAPAAATEQTKARVDDPYRVDHPNSKPTTDTAQANVKPTAVAAPQPEVAAPLPKPARSKSAESPKEVAVAKPDAAAVVSSTPVKPAEPLPKAEQAPVLKFDPLTFDPDHLGAAGGSFADIKPLAGSVPSEPPAARANNQPNDPAAAADVPPQGAVPAAPVQPRVQPAVFAERGQAGNAPQQTAAQLLAAPVKSLVVDAVPLSRLVTMLSDFAGAGVTLDPVALELAGVSPRTPFAVNASDSTVEAVLRKTLGEHHLDLAVQGGRARVVLANASERRTFDCDVKDLVSSADAAGVAQLVQHFVAPKAWKASGRAGTIAVDGTTLHVEQSEAVRREVLIFLERLRLARGLPLRTKYPATLLAAKSPYQKLSAKLDERTTFTFIAWTRLADFVRQLEQLSGLAILVDWSALADTELSPSSPVACSANDRSWQESLDGVLEPLSLGWWAVDGETIQITSQASLNQVERLEFHQVPSKFRSQFANNQALLAALQQVASGAGKPGRAGQPRIAVDEPSGRLIVLASPAVQRAIAQKLAAAK